MVAKVGGRRRYSKDEDMDIAGLVMQFLRDKLDPDDLAHVEEMFEESEEPQDENMTVDSARRIDRSTVRVMNEIAEAQRQVAPFVGHLPAMDSAGKIYKAALTKMGHDTVGLHPTAARAMWGLLRSQGPKHRPLSAADSATYAERFPGANSLKLR